MTQRPRPKGRHAYASARIGAIYEPREAER
jgi:hypothetical protein